jgi:hypothetical protein
MADKESSTERQRFREFIPDQALEHARTACVEMCRSLEGLLPPEFVAHQRVARKEMLLAVRSMIDASLERIETEQAAE